VVASGIQSDESAYVLVGCDLVNRLNTENRCCCASIGDVFVIMIFLTLCTFSL